MRVTLEQKKRDFRTIFELWYDTPRIEMKEIVNALGIDKRAVRNRIKEALEHGYIVGPCLKKKSYMNLREYISLFRCENPRKTYFEYVEDNNIVYHAVMDGFCDLWTISKEKFKIDGDVVAEGFPTDYHVSFPPNITWNASFKNIRLDIKTFNPEMNTPKHILKTHWDQTVEWTEIDEILYEELKYNFRGSLTQIREKHQLWKGHVIDSYRKIPERCNIFTYFYPESMGAYDPYLYMFETDYEDFIIDLFSQLPTSALFFKINDKLFAHLFIDRQFLRNINSKIPDFSQLHIPLIIEDLLEKKIIEKVSRAFISYHWRKNL